MLTEVKKKKKTTHLKKNKLLKHQITFQELGGSLKVLVHVRGDGGGGWGVGVGGALGSGLPFLLCFIVSPNFVSLLLYPPSPHKYSPSLSKVRDQKHQYWKLLYFASFLGPESFSPTPGRPKGRVRGNDVTLFGLFCELWVFFFGPKF